MANTGYSGPGGAMNDNQQDRFRDVWIDQTARLLAEHLETLDYDADQCRELAERLWDLPKATKAGGMQPAERVLDQLIQDQGTEPATAGILARSAPHLDWSKLVAPSPVAQGLLGVARVTLTRYHNKGILIPAVEHFSKARAETRVYWLHDLLYRISQDRYYPAEQGRGYKRFPYLE